LNARAFLDRKCAELGVPATRLQSKKILHWVGLLQRWNKAYNLTALIDTHTIIKQLVITSLRAIPYLHGNRVVDVGSGSGVPGIPLAIFAPQYRYTLLDSNAKKVRFMHHCRMFLELANVRVAQARAESFQPAAQFDTVISRALSSLEHFVLNTVHLGHQQTHWLAFKGTLSEHELHGLHSVARDLGLRHSLQKLGPRKINRQRIDQQKIDMQNGMSNNMSKQGQNHHLVVIRYATNG